MDASSLLIQLVIYEYSQLRIDVFCILTSQHPIVTLSSGGGNIYMRVCVWSNDVLGGITSVAVHGL